MRRRPIEDPQLIWARDLVERQVSHLARLVDDLLDVSRITRGAITLAREPVLRHDRADARASRRYSP